jgi:putative DNA primase/helicase
MIEAALLARARDADLLATAERLGASLKRISATERAGPCPLCGGTDRFAVNSKLQVWNCRGCGKGGKAIDLVMHVHGVDFREAVAFLSGENTAPKPALVRPAAGPRTDNGDNQEKALALWRQRRPIVGTVAETYLREARECRGIIPPILGFLPARGKHAPSLIAAFGFATEPEPGVLSIADADVRAVHIIRLKPDGSGKVDDHPKKITLGRGALGVPIMVAAINDLLGLAICEGPEDAVSTHQATGLGAWAAGGATRLPALAAAVPTYVEHVTIVADDNAAGIAGANALADALSEREIQNAVIFLEAPK